MKQEFFCPNCMKWHHIKHKSDVKTNCNFVCNSCVEVITKKKQEAKAQAKKQSVDELLSESQTRPQEKVSNRKWREIEAKKEELALNKLMSDDYLMI